MSNPSFSEYSKRMHRVLDYIDAHLDAELDLPTLAGVAHFSPYHFHRIFAAWMNETLGEYMRRRRLEHAALLLACKPPRSVLEVALAVGFGSGEAFSRAFKLHFSCTPSAWQKNTGQRWAREMAQIRARMASFAVDGTADNAGDNAGSGRQDSNPDQINRKPDQAGSGQQAQDAVSALPLKETSMKVTLTELPAAKIAFLRHIGPYGKDVNIFWTEVFHPWMQAQGLSDRTLYGIGHDDPSITPAEKCRYDACIEVGADFVATGPAMLTTLPGGRYAIANFKGTFHEIGAAWFELLRNWLPNSGMQCDNRPCFERYPQEDAYYDPASGVFSCQLCIPVRPL